MGASTRESSIAAFWPGLAAAIGLLLLVTGLVLPAAADPSGALTEQQTKEYLESHAALEKAAVGQGRRRAGQKASPDPNAGRKLEAARQRFDDAKQQVEAAKAGSAKWAFGLKLAGAALALAGASGLLAGRT